MPLPPDGTEGLDDDEMLLAELNDPATEVQEAVAALVAQAATQAPQPANPPPTPPGHMDVGTINWGIRIDPFADKPMKKIPEITQYEADEYAYNLNKQTLEYEYAVGKITQDQFMEKLNELKKKRATKKKPEPEAEVKVETKADPQLDPRTRTSIYGNKFGASLESHWQKFDDMWVHQRERDDFMESYAQCHVTDKWISKGLMLQLVMPNGDKDEDNGWISLAEAKEPYITCTHTGYVVHEDNTFEHRDLENIKRRSCLSCQSDYRECPVIGAWYRRAHGVIVAKSKHYPQNTWISSFALNKSGKFAKCGNCGKWFDSEDVKVHPESKSLFPSGCKVCEDCHLAMLHKNSIAPYNDTHYPAPIYTIEPRMGHKVVEGGGIRALNKRVTQDVPMNFIRLFGAEAEVELNKPACVKLNLTRFDMAVTVKGLLGSDFCQVKEDGSLTANGKYSGDSAFDPDGSKNGKKYAGFEIVSAPCDLATHRERWSRLATCAALHTGKSTEEKPLGDSLLRAWDTDTCGFHVHVSRSVLSDLQIGRMLRFVNHEANQRFIHKIAGRGSDRFCRYIPKELVDSRHPERVTSPEEARDYDRQRRVALNIVNPKTVEFRIFRGTIHPAHILRNLVFCDAVCDFCHPAARSLKDMDDYGQFIHFVSSNRKKYQELAEWFAYQKHITLKKVGEGADITKFTIHPDMVAEAEFGKSDPPKPAKTLVKTTKPKKAAPAAQTHAPDGNLW